MARLVGGTVPAGLYDSNHLIVCDRGSGEVCEGVLDYNL